MSEVKMMEQITEEEAYFLLKTLQAQGAKCSLEFHLAGMTDPFLGIADEPIKVDFVEGPPDIFVIHLGEAEFGFECGRQYVCNKAITDCQIMVVISDENFVAWFSSGTVTPECISQATSYNPVKFVFSPEEVPLDEHETALIMLIRALEFEDLLDAEDGIREQIRSAENMYYRHLASNDYRANGFLERAKNLGALADQLGMANADYRNHTTPAADEE